VGCRSGAAGQLADIAAEGSGGQAQALGHGEVRRPGGTPETASPPAVVMTSESRSNSGTALVLLSTPSFRIPSVQVRCADPWIASCSSARGSGMFRRRAGRF
jgi:hypothetical protein